jgi:prevent-host-death family protein
METMGYIESCTVETIAMKQFTTGDLNKQIGDITDAASREPVMLTRHKKPRFVLMSYEHYERMRSGGDPRRAYHISADARPACGTVRRGARSAGARRRLRR